MIEWFTWAQVAVAGVAGLFCLVSALMGRSPNDYTLGALALVELLLIAQLICAIVAPAVGNVPSGSGLEFWIYLVSALLVPPAAVVWSLLDRGRWSTAVLAVACGAVAVMVYRMSQIWFVQN